MPARTLFVVIYACSGAAALIYEIVWMRLLSLQLGHTVAAAGTVLAGFMGGLAAGALVGGQVASRLDRVRALQAYAALELMIALGALALPLALAALEPPLVWAYGEEPALTFAFVRLAASLVLVFIPAAAMGATFPLAIRWFASDRLAAGREAGGLYAVNTVGAAVGALATGFVLIPQIGLRATTGVGIALNVTAAAGAWLIANKALVSLTPTLSPVAGGEGGRAGEGERRLSSAPKRGARARARSRTEGIERPLPAWLPAAVLGISGFAALVYEVAFTRVLALALGPTTYAFAAMVAAFISGLAIGAALASRVAWHEKAPEFWLALLMLASALAASAAGWFAGTRLPLLVAEAVANPSGNAGTILVREALWALGVLLPLSCALGAVFPLGVAVAARRDEGRASAEASATAGVAREASIIYGVNTIGAVAGSLAGAFVLVPLLGLQRTLRLAGVFAIGAAVLIIVIAQLTRRQRAVAILAAAAAGTLLFLVPAWDLNLLSSGGYKYATNVRDLDLDLATGLRAGRLLYYKEGAAATVSVRRLAGTVSLAIDGKVDASNWTDMLTQKLLGHLPLLLHPDPHEVCIIGLGSGVTLGAVLQHGIDRADVIEISPEVVDASSFFADENGRALEDPRTRLIVGDGRSHLQLTSRRYDVIISEPSNPWMAGVASLFTREFFLAARDKLAPGGVLCQWAHTYDIADADLRSIAATFATVFPNGAMWLVGESDVLFIASNDPIEPRLDDIARAWGRPGVAEDLAKVSVVDTFSLLSLYVAGPRDVLRYGQGAFIQTDDRTLLEFSGPRGVFDRRGAENVPALRALLDPAHAPAAVRTAVAAAGALEWSHRGQMHAKAQAHLTAYNDFARALELDADNEIALNGLIDAAGAGQRLGDAQRVLESLASARPGSAAVRIALARLLAVTGLFDQAAARAAEAMAADPQNPRGLETLASIFADAGDADRLRPLVMRMQQMHPERDETWYYAATASFLEGNLPEAIARAERVIQMNAQHAPAHNLIGAAAASLGQRERARQAFRASLAASPMDASTYANLGLLEKESGNREAAVAYFTESLTLDPHDEVARTNLAALARR